MLLKQYKLQLEFTFNIHELTEETVHESMKGFSNYDEIVQWKTTWEHAERQKNLLHALLKNPAIVDEFSKTKMVSLFEAYGAEQVMDEFPIPDDDEKILLPLVQELDSKDAKAFYDANEENLFFENMSIFNECFKLELTNANFKENSLNNL
jgi:hypothetical protein